jgi:hypothetical protein
MKVTRIITDNNGISKFKDIEIPLFDSGKIGKLSERFPVKDIIFRETDEDYDYDWHNAPEKQFIIILEGGVEIQTGDGNTRVFQGGDVLLVEDTEGQGHISKSFKNQKRKSIFVTIEEDKFKL